MNVLWKDNRTEYTVVIPADAMPTERHAADELARFIGRGLTVRPDGGSGLDETACVLSLGNTSILRDAAVDISGVTADGYRIVTRGRTVVLTAKNQSGLLNAAYGFMRAVWGFKTYTFDVFGTSDAPEMTFGALDITDNPAFIGRDAHFKEVMEGIHPYYASRMRLNGIRSQFNEDEGDGTVWCRRLWAHTQFRLLPKEKYLAAHPDWYSADGTTLCWTNEAARKELTENLKAYILEYPKAVFFSVTQEDGATRCTCEHCRKSDETYGNTAGTMMRFVNAVARDIKAWLQTVAPERTVYLVTFAYQNTLDAPVVEKDGTFTPVDPSVVAEDNVLVRLAPLYNCFSHDILTAPCNRHFRNALLGWHAVAAHLAVWSYCIGFGCYMVPFGNFETMQNVYRTYRQYGFVDVLDQGAADTEATHMARLRVFLQSELLWDPEADFEALIRDYCEHVYLDAAPFMQEYIRLTRQQLKDIEAIEAVNDEQFHARPSARYSRLWERGEWWTKQYVTDSVELFRKATEVAGRIADPAARERTLAHLKTDSLSCRYLLITSYCYGMDKEKAAALIDAFERDAAACKLTHYRESFKVSFKIDETRRYVLDGSCFL